MSLENLFFQDLFLACSCLTFFAITTRTLVQTLPARLPNLGTQQRVAHACATGHAETAYLPRQTKRMNYIILNEDEEQPFIAPRRSRTPSENFF